MILELREKTYQEQLKALRLPSLVYRRRRGDMIVMFKIQNGMMRIDSTDLFTPLEFSRTRGHQYRVYKGGATKQQRKSSFSQRVVNDWNNLPNYVVDAPSLDVFKNLLDVHWSEHHYDTMND